MKKILFMVVAVLVEAWVIAGIADAIQFHEIQRGVYMTPWYSGNWLREPYTCFRVALSGNVREHWTKNAVGDDWYVREAVINEKEWWTILKKIEVVRAEAIH